MAHLESSPHSPTSSAANPQSVSHPYNPHRMKLEVPRFDVSNPSGWIFKITKFFEYHFTPDHECLTIASFYMESLALARFQWMTCIAQISSWFGLL